MQVDVNTTISFDVVLNKRKKEVTLKANILNADFLKMLEIDLDYWEDTKTIKYNNLDYWFHFEMNSLYFRIHILKETKSEFKVYIYESSSDETLDVYTDLVEYEVNLQLI